MGMTDMANNFLWLVTAAGIALVLLLVGYLAVATVTAPKGRHALAGQPRHRGWEGREDELKQITAAHLIAKHSTPRWPVRDWETQEIPVVREEVPA